MRSWSEIAGDAWGMLCDCGSQLCSRSSQQIIAGHNVEQLLHRLWLQKLGCVAWRDRPALPARRLQTVDSSRWFAPRCLLVELDSFSPSALQILLWLQQLGCVHGLALCSASRSGSALDWRPAPRACRGFSPATARLPALLSSQPPETRGLCEERLV